MKFVRHFLHPQLPQPDTPQPFGYKSVWLTLAATDAATVAQTFDLRDLQPCTWMEGVRPDPYGRVFVSPPVHGWIFVVGQPFALPDEHHLGDRLTPILIRLSHQFGVAHYFMTHRVVECHVWARAEAGTLIRGYAYLGERGETLWNEGAPTTEAELGLRFFDETSSEAAAPAYWERSDLRFPDEASVMQMARKWCIAPIDLTPNDSSPALGIRGVVPPS
jgi:hypothetical protein